MGPMASVKYVFGFVIFLRLRFAGAAGPDSEAPWRSFAFKADFTACMRWKIVVHRTTAWENMSPG